MRALFNVIYAAPAMPLVGILVALFSMPPYQRALSRFLYVLAWLSTGIGTGLIVVAFAFSVLLYGIVIAILAGGIGLVFLVIGARAVSAFRREAASGDVVSNRSGR